jgi:serine/threonine protein kinase
LIGQTLAHYRITAALGAGGMGEVYRATDTKLGRNVALKVLPPEVAQDPERLGRFEREARLLGALNHPNVAAIHGLEEVGSTRFLVLELVDGEDLSERLKRGAIAVEEATGIALQIAQALEAAHEKGIVHRDLKPANVKLTPDGQVKVLDFGLAKAWTGEGAASGSSSSLDLSQSPTLVHSGTQAGVILGTAAYMSPEQARGKTVDKRADVWAFGVVLFEMLTGQRLFTGETVSDILAAVLKEEPPWGKLPPGLPVNVRRVLRRCLRKQPRDRFHDIADVRLELAEAPETEASPSEGAPRSPWPRRALPWALALVAAGVATWLGLRSSDERSSPRTVVASILPPPGAEFLTERGLALSPDGRDLVFAARDEQGATELWLRRLDDPAARKLAGTEEGGAPFWSPDGRHVGFFASGTLKRIELQTGLVENVVGLPTDGGGGSGAWGPDGEIVFGDWGSALNRVAARGGAPVEVSPAETTPVERAWPTFLPGGKRFLYLWRDYGDSKPLRELRASSLDGGLDRDVLSLNSNALYSSSGYLAWWQDGNLRAQRFDPERLAASGEPRVIAAGVEFDPSSGLGAFSLSGTTLVYREGGLRLGEELVRVARSGEELGPVGPPGNYYHPRLSPDGSRVAVDRSDETNRGDIWVYEVERGTGTRLSAAPEDESSPNWSPDGSRIAFWAALGERNLIRVLASGDAGPAEEFPIDGFRPRLTDWSVGDVLFVERGGDIWAGTLAEGSFKPFVETPFTEKSAVASADGRLVAYDSDETGRPEVYVRTFPDSGKRWRVSTDGGRTPVWRRDGGEIYFVDANERITAVTVSPSPGDLRLGRPRALFHAELKQSERAQFDTLDGETFLVNRTRRTGSGASLTLVLNVDFGAPENRRE